MVALSAIVTEPRRLPEASGANVIVMVQLFPAATLAGQLLLWAKSPLAVTLEMARAALPVLVNVTVCAALMLPTAWLLNVSVLVERLTTGTASPMPDSGTVCVLPATFPVLSVTVRVPVLVPAAVGVNVTLIVQVVLAERIEPHVLLWLKSPAATMLEMLNGASPVLLKITCCAALATPTDWPVKPRLAGESEACGSKTPVPVAKITCGLPDPLSVSVIAPMLPTAAEGVKMT